MYLYVWDSLYVILSGVHKAWFESDLENQQEGGKQEYFDRKLVFSTGKFTLSSLKNINSSKTIRKKIYNFIFLKKMKLIVIKLRFTSNFFLEKCLFSKTIVFLVFESSKLVVRFL